MLKNLVIAVELTNRQTTLPPDEPRLAEAVRRVLAGEGIARAEVSVALVDDREMRELNRQFLAHDYATDVLSFVLEATAERLEGEIVVSADTAVAAAEKYGWPAEDELLLYVVHGALHLAGWDDAGEEQAATMRRRERHYLASFGLLPPAAEEALLAGGGGSSKP